MFKKHVEWLEGDKARARKWALVLLTIGYLGLILAGFILILIDSVQLSGFLTLFGSYTSIYAIMIGFYCKTNPNKESN